MAFFDYILVFVGFCWAGVGVWQLAVLRRREETGYAAEAEIIYVVGESDSSGEGGSGLLYYPIVRMMDPGGKAIEQKLDIGMSPSLWRRGGKINVVCVDGVLYPSGTWITVLYAGIILLGVSIVAYRLILWW